MTSKGRRHRVQQVRSILAKSTQTHTHDNHQDRQPIPASIDAATKTLHVKASSRHQRRDNEPNKGDTMSDPIPLSHLLLEGLGRTNGSQSVDTLERQILAAGHPVVIDYIGRKAVSRDIAKQLLAEHQAKVLAHREREHRRAAEHKAEIARIRARYPLRGGVPTTPGSNNAYADLMGHQ